MCKHDIIYKNKSTQCTVLSSEQDRATATGNLYRKSCEAWDMLADRQTDKHTFRHADHYTLTLWWQCNKPSVVPPTVTCSKSCPNSCEPATTSRSAIHCSRSSMSLFSIYSFSTSSSFSRRSPARSFRLAYSLSTCACFTAIASLHDKECATHQQRLNAYMWQSIITYTVQEPCNEVHLNYVKCIIVYTHITLALYRLD